jgi:hypothetical protein
VSHLWHGALSPRTRALRNRCFRNTSSSAAIVECWSALPGATHALRRVKLQSKTPPALSRLSSVGTHVRGQSTPLAYCALLPRSRCSRTHSIIPTCAPLALWIQFLADTPGDVLQELTGAPATYLPAPPGPPLLLATTPSTATTNSYQCAFDVAPSMLLRRGHHIQTPSTRRSWMTPCLVCTPTPPRTLLITSLTAAPRVACFSISLDRGTTTCVYILPPTSASGCTYKRRLRPS